MRIDLTLRTDDGSEHDVAVLAPDGARWRDVAPLLQVGTGGGPALSPQTPLGHGGLLSGRVLAGADCGPHPDRLAATHRLDVVGGPDSGRGVRLGRAPLTVGRGRDCDLVLHDPDVSRVHAELALTAHGPTVRDCGSSNGTSIDGTDAGAGAVAVRPDHYVRLGDSYLRVSEAEPLAALTRAGPGATVLVNRPPRSNTPLPDLELALPSAPAAEHPQRVQWLAALVPAAAGVALAVSMHAPQFLLFALLSPIAMLATSLGDRVHWRREHRRRHAQYRRELAVSRRRICQALAAETRARRDRDPDPATVQRTAQLPGARLWERGRHSPDALRVRVGLGDLQSSTRIRDGTVVEPAGTVRAVPVTVDLADGPLGVTGPRPIAEAVARWLVGQLAVQLSPADVEIALLLSAETEPAWTWVRWLPQWGGRVATGADERRALLTELAELQAQRGSRTHPDGRWPGAWLVLVVDRCTDLAGLAGLGELLADGTRTGITALCIDDRPAGLPAACASVARVAGEVGSRLQLSGRASAVVADQVSAGWADRTARALAPLQDPRTGAGGSVPASCRLLPLLGLPDPTPEQVLARWRRCGPRLVTALGLASDGPLRIDLERDGPHALVAGTTGAGKSELLRTLVAGLALAHPPESVVFVLIDYKGGAAFADCARLPHTVGVVTDLDSHLAARALHSLERELARREQLFASAGARDLDGYRAGRPPQPLPRLVIIIDEFAELAAELDDFVPGLVGIARRGRSLGVHLVLATQRPGGVVSPEIRANTALRIALRVTDPAESRDVIEVDSAVAIGRRQAGRAYLRLPGTPAELFQTAQVSGTPGHDAAAAPAVVTLGPWRQLPDTGPGDGAATDLQLLVEAARGAAAHAGCAPPRSPWLAPLPEHVAVSALGSDEDGQIPIGLVDLPHAQRQQPLRIDLAEGGSLLLAGGPRSGRSSALLSLAIGAAAALPPDRLHIYAIDCAGDGLAALEQLPHLGSYVGAEFASTATLIGRLDAEVGHRRRAGAAQPATALPRMLCVLDGWEAFASAADEYDGGRTVQTLLGLLRAGPSAGLTLAITGDRDALAVRLSAAVDTKLLLRLTDRADFALAGVPDRAVPVSLPPGRAVRAADAAEVQLAHLGADPSPAERALALERAGARWADTASSPVAANPPIRVRPLPGQVALATLPPLPGRITLGVGGDGADPIAVDLFAGPARLLVAGPPRSGRTSVLAGVLRQLHAQGQQIVAAAPARSPLAALAAAHGVRVIAPDDPGYRPADPAGPAALLVDDSEAFLDTAAGDALTEWIRAAHSQLAVVAAGSSDELAVCFRGLAAEVRRSRCTVLLHPGPGDGELAGVTVARVRTSSPPGRGVLIGDPAWGPQFASGPVPIQIALP